METLKSIDKSLTVCKIPATVEYIEEKVFSCCSNLESIECESDFFKLIDGVLFTADGKTLVRYPPKKSGTHYVVPDSVVNIRSFAFKNCEFLENIILPDSLTTIGERAFYNCKSLQGIILPNSITKICEATFYNCYGLQEIKLPDTLLKIDRSAFEYCKSLREIDLPNSITEMGDSVFRNCKSLRKINIPTSLEYIPACAFSSCVRLKNITLPNSIKHIRDYAFAGCELLREIKLSEGLIDIDCSVFSWCKAIYVIELPNSIISINDSAFLGCESLETIKLPNSIQHIGYSVFEHCKSLEAIECNNEYYCTINGVLFDKKEKKCIGYPPGRIERSYVIPDGTLAIGKSAFESCYDLEAIILPASVQALEDRAFQSCWGLKSIKLPDQLNSIAPAAFLDCSRLKSIECDSSFFKSIDGVLFTADLKTLVCYPQGRYCENYVIPDSVIKIAKEAFSSEDFSRSCERVTLPKSLTEFDTKTFHFHEELKWIECDNEHYKSIDGVLFTADCKTLVYYPRGRKDSQYIIPDTVTKIENRAFALNRYLHKIIVPKDRMEDFIKMFPEDNEYELAKA